MIGLRSASPYGLVGANSIDIVHPLGALATTLPVLAAASPQPEQEGWLRGQSPRAPLFKQLLKHSLLQEIVIFGHYLYQRRTASSCTIVT